MSRVQILAAAHHPDPNTWAGLHDTCALFGAPLHVLGTDKHLGYASNDPRLFNESVHEAIQFLESTDAEYIVITDAFDVLCCRWDEAELINRIEAAPGSLIVSCEANCFPDGPWRARYEALSGSPWRYANAGQSCGTRAAMLAYIRELEKGVRGMKYSATGGAAQEVLHAMFCDGYPMAIDSQCHIFQSMYTFWSGQIGFNVASNGTGLNIVKNLCTESSPMFLHFNGRATGMDLWYRALTGTLMPRNPMRPEYTEVI